MGDSNQPKLKMVTNLHSDLPKEYIELLAEHIRKSLKRDVEINYNEKWRGGGGREPAEDNNNPFSSDQADFGIITAATYIRVTGSEADAASLELLPVTALHAHPALQGTTAYFSDSITHMDNRKKYEEDFEKLRGCGWTYSDSRSLSGAIYPRHRLRGHGENAPSFFGDLSESGSHLQSIEMIRDGRTEVGCVSSLALSVYFKQHPEAQNEIFRVASLGPLPMYAIVVNRKLPGDVKENLRIAFFSINDDQELKGKLEQYCVERFAENSPESYNLEKDVIKDIRHAHRDAPFY